MEQCLRKQFIIINLVPVENKVLKVPNPYILGCCSYSVEKAKTEDTELGCRSVKRPSNKANGCSVTDIRQTGKLGF